MIGREGALATLDETTLTQILRKVMRHLEANGVQLRLDLHAKEELRRLRASGASLDVVGARSLRARAPAPNFHPTTGQDLRPAMKAIAARTFAPGVSRKAVKTAYGVAEAGDVNLTVPEIIADLSESLPRLINVLLHEAYHQLQGRMFGPHLLSMTAGAKEVAAETWSAVQMRRLAKGQPLLNTFRGF